MTQVTVTGPGLERRMPSSGVGISLALTYALRAKAPASYYVRDRDEQVVGRADADGMGRVEVYGFDRASGGGTRGVAPARSAENPRPLTKEEPRMSEQTPAAKKAPTKRAAAKRAPAAQKKPAEKAEKGTDLLATLMRQVEEKVPGVERLPNKSHTYTRLLVGGKAFAYVFPPRPGGLLVKIPKQLLSVERELPKEHGFKRGEYGLTRTIKKASEAPKVTQALAVAASAVTAAPAEQEAST